LILVAVTGNTATQYAAESNEDDDEGGFHAGEPETGMENEEDGEEAIRYGHVDGSRACALHRSNFQVQRSLFRYFSDSTPNNAKP
jgi:hypothetical protein